LSVLLACCHYTNFKSITCNIGFKLLEQLASHISFITPGVSDPAIVVVLFLFRCCCPLLPRSICCNRYAISSVVASIRVDGAVNAWRSLCGSVCCDGDFSRSRGGSRDGPRSNREGECGLGANGDDW
ncbi:hypothetical protein V8G54_029071, partial [Vigna mungo]